ncbi:hypothetical protein PU634_06965 [Oceanimonas pelagia]|uniref:Uncharacterized protein n=1 Tax=Oceanimonas pelagia TaxID=3028314 RepID=A0AA50QBJ8_9GAMM|nr:hypothetical protein [Oceanimonas pelagia]WMC12098.1 hypothetical protein PU634_06965 [Oceanimonas pelagia]
MAIDVAFSIEANDYIDPDRAYDLYWSGIITDKKKFICPGTDCTAQVTCANLDEDLQDMKVVPHYRIYGKHSEGCEIFNDKPLNLKCEDGTSIKEEKRTVDESIVDVFLLERPDSYYDEARTDAGNNSQAIKKPGFVRRSKDTRLREAGSIGNIYSVRSVVGRYIRYRNDGSIDQRRVNILGKNIYYRSIFKCIWEQDLDDLPNHPVIYYGWAFVNRLPSGAGYQIKFKKKFKKGDDEYTSTIMIADRLIESYEIKKLVATRLEKIKAQGKPTAFVFVYGEPKENVSKAGNKYANFSITNLDMIDINYDCPLPREYNK